LQLLFSSAVGFLGTAGKQIVVEVQRWRNEFATLPTTWIPKV
jgi:hypothetical protein